jgi:hypothetical protein
MSAGAPVFVEFAAEPVVVERFVADRRADRHAIEQGLDAAAVVAAPRQAQKRSYGGNWVTGVRKAA